MGKFDRQTAVVSAKPASRHRYRKLGLAMAAVLSPNILVLSAAHAQTSEPADQADARKPVDQANAGDIVVTAERRATPLQKTPIAISHYDERRIADLNINNVQQLEGHVPNLIMPAVSSQKSASSYFMRGIGEPSLEQESPVGLYIDDVFIPRVLGSVTDLPGVTSIDVLRGPQGTLFGRNSAAGLISVKTKDPTQDLEGSAGIEVGNYNAVRLSASLNVPITDKIAANIAYIRSTRDGYMYSVTRNEKLLNIHTDTLRMKIKATPTEKLTILLAADGIIDQSSGSVYPPLNQPNGVGGAKFDPNLTWVSVGTPTYLRSGGLSLHLEYSVNDNLMLKSVSSIRAFYNTNLGVNDGGTSYIFNESDTAWHEKAMTEELQAIYKRPGFNLVTGFFYLHESFDQTRIVWNGGTTVNVGTQSNILISQKLDSWAPYAQAELEPFSNFYVTLGARYSHDNKDFTSHGFAFPTTFTTAGPPFYAPNPPPSNATGFWSVAPSKSWGRFTPKIELRYQWTPSIMQYVSFTKGYKAGGFDTRATNALAASTPFNPETVDTYEAGLKSRFFDNKLTANLAVFYSNFKDLQLSAYDPTLNLTHLYNAGKAKNAGAELEVTARPVERVELSFNANYLYTKINSPNTILSANAFGQTTFGERLPYAPRWTLSGEASYSLPVSYGTWRVNGNARYQSRSFNDLYNTQQYALPGQAYLDLGLSWTSLGKALELGVRAENVTDNRASQGIGIFPNNGPTVLRATGGQQYTIPHPPRFVRIYANYSF